MTVLLREPLLHFIVLGSAIFILFAIFDDAPPPVAADRLEVTEADAVRLARQFEATWRRPPTETELSALIDNRIREEALVREARALGLDRDDALVRQRLAQKMTFVLESDPGAAVPTDANLAAHLEAHPDRFRRSALVAFEQIAIRGEEPETVLAALRAGAVPAGLGGMHLLPAQMAPSPAPVVDGTFGAGFFDAVAALPEGEWAGPVESGYGSHLVRLRTAVQSRLPPLAEIRDAVERDWRATRRAALFEARLDALMGGYDILRPDGGIRGLIRLAFLLAVLIAMLPGRAPAHALEPGFLEIAPLAGDAFAVTWRKPQVQRRPMAIYAVLPEGCVPRRGTAPIFDGSAFVSGWAASCPDGLGGGTIGIEGLDATRTDVLVRYTLAAGDTPQTRRLTPGDATFVVPPSQGPLARFGDFFALGVDHILAGLDHLLFVFALLLLIRRVQPLVAAITSFTVAHSISLAAATLGWIVVPGPPVEAIVALSIVILSAELAQPPGQGLRLTERYPWTVAFGFGLLHGLGFAGALIDLGLPQSDVPLALLAFNLGVEAGQLMFIAAVVAAGLFLSRLLPTTAPLLSPGSHTLRAAAYAMGTLATWWMVDRVAGFAT